MSNTYRAMEITSPRVFSLVERRLPSPAPDRFVSASRLAVYAIRMRQLWKHNSPTFLIRASLATRLSDE